jgi:hypothetical protein
MADAVIPWGGKEGDPVPTRYLVYTINRTSGGMLQVPAIAHSEDDAIKAVLIRHPNHTVNRVARAKNQFVGWEP